MSRPPRPGCRPCNNPPRFARPRLCVDCLSRAEQQEQDWYRKTGHCGYCGDPGVFCTCTQIDPCGCRELHDMGSGLLPDALEAFMPSIVTVDQGELFGDVGA